MCLCVGCRFAFAIAIAILPDALWLSLPPWRSPTNSVDRATAYIFMRVAVVKVAKKEMSSSRMGIAKAKKKKEYNKNEKIAVQVR